MKSFVQGSRRSSWAAYSPGAAMAAQRRWDRRGTGAGSAVFGRCVSSVFPRLRGGAAFGCPGRHRFPPPRRLRSCAPPPEIPFTRAVAGRLPPVLSRPRLVRNPRSLTRRSRRPGLNTTVYRFAMSHRLVPLFPPLSGRSPEPSSSARTSLTRLGGVSQVLLAVLSAAVVVDVGEDERLRDELELLRDIHLGEPQLAAGRGIPHQQARGQVLSDLPSWESFGRRWGWRGFV